MDSQLITAIITNWATWFVSIVLVFAAIIDGIKLKVPNWLTFPLIVSGWIYSSTIMGWEGLVWSFLGTAVGLVLLLPAYSIGGMGAGDVKLLAGVGSWIHAAHTFHAFAVSAVLGAFMAMAMVLHRRSWARHVSQFWAILNEIITIRNPNELAHIAAERKNSMLLLPYGIPIAIGSITYFAWQGMLL